MLFGLHMMTLSNGNIFRVTGPLWGEFTGDWWIPLTKAIDAVLWCFFHLRLNKQLSKPSRRWWIETPSRSLRRHCNDHLPVLIALLIYQKGLELAMELILIKNRQVWHKITVTLPISTWVTRLNRLSWCCQCSNDAIWINVQKLKQEAGITMDEYALEKRWPKMFYSFIVHRLLERPPPPPPEKIIIKMCVSVACVRYLDTA